MGVATSISKRIIDSALGKQLEPGARLGEQELATLFDCSRTIIREAMVDLAARDIVVVIPRRGWFLAEVDVVKARELYTAREIIETGLLRILARTGQSLEAAPLERIRAHLEQQKAAVEGSDANRRSFLLGEFHVCLAECLGSTILADKLKDLTVLTTLFTMRHQTPGDAWKSYEEHVAIIDALAANDITAAERCMLDHLGTWETKVHVAPQDPLDGLRRALTQPD